MNTRRRRRKKQNPTVILFALLIFTLMLGTVFLLLSLEISSGAGEPEPVTENIRAIAPTENVPAENLVETLDIRLTAAYTTDIFDTGYLALVNRQHGIANEPDPGVLVPAWPTVPVSTTIGMYLHPTALNAVAEMFDSAREADIGSFFVSSGFRSYELQAELYGDGSNSAFVLPPGFSEHQTGLAVDIMALGIGQWELANSPQGQWLANNSWRYGLILRYPEGATHITGIAFEPWHFRYVGKIHAYYMWRHNLVLEQYIERLQTLGSITIEKNGQTHLVLSQTAENGMINLPDGAIASGDNMGGVIIWSILS